jgi:Ca-activated chloride channel family protein
MFETMSIYSLVLMLSAALLFPLAFRYLLGAPHTALLKSSWRLWAVTLPFAALCWYLAALWAQSSRPLITSLTVIMSLLVLFPLVFTFLPIKPHTGLGRHALTLAILLAYASVCWMIKSLFAAATGATLDAQALIFGYLLLCPALAAALLPRPRPIGTGMFILLTALFLYAVGVWATSAFWGTMPALPAWSLPVIVIFASLVMLALPVWITWQARDMPMARRVAAQIISLGRWVLELVGAIGPALLTFVVDYVLAFITIVADYARLFFSAIRWIISVLIPGIGVAVARGSVVLFQLLWRGVKSIPALFWNITVGIGNAVINAVIWFVSVPILGIGRGIIAVGEGLWHGLVNISRWLFRASVWLVTIALPSLLVATPRLLWRAGIWLVTVFAPGVGRRLVAIVEAVVNSAIRLMNGIAHALVAAGRSLWHACVWLVTDLVPGTGLALWHGIRALGRGLARAVVWVVTAALPATGRESVALVRQVGRGLIAIARGVWDGLGALVHGLGRLLPALARGTWRAGVWLLTGLIPGIAQWLLMALRAAGRGITLLARGSLHAIRAAVHALIRAVAWSMTIVLPSIGRGLAAALRAIRDALLASARRLARALVWLITVAPVVAARKMLAAARTGATWLAGLLRDMGRALVWTVTVLLPGIPGASLILLRRAVAVIRGAVYTLRVGFVSMVVAPVLGIGRAVRGVALPVLQRLRTVPLPVFLLSATVFVVVVEVALTWSYIESMIWPPSPPSLRVAGGSNLKSLEPILQRWGLENQVTVQVTYRGSLDIQSSLEDGSIQYDAVWQGDSLWATIGGKGGFLKDSQSIMCSPVVLGVKKPVASRLGWTGNNQVRLQEILDTAESAKLRMFMASPAKSSSGALAYLGFLNSFDFNPNRATRLLRRIERTGDSSGWVRDACRDQYGRCDAMINYESLILEMNQEMVKRGEEPMYIVYPVEGLGMADFPLSYVNKSSAEKESLFLRLQSYMQSDAVQSEIAARGNRVGAGCGRVNETIFKSEWGADLTRATETVQHPEKPVIDQARNLYQTTFRKPSFTVYLLDFSSSMQGSRRAYLQMAMSVVLDQKQAARYVIQGTSDDVTVVIPFAGRTLNDDDIRSWTVSGSDSEELGALLKKIQTQPTADMTNIYTPVARALHLMKEEDIANYMPSIILLTDGESNRGSIEEVKRALAESGLYNVPVFGITFGDALQQQLNELAGLTGGRVFDGTKDLIEAFRQAKGQN